MPATPLRSGASLGGDATVGLSSRSFVVVSVCPPRSFSGDPVASRSISVSFLVAAGWSLRNPGGAACSSRRYFDAGMAAAPAAQSAPGATAAHLACCLTSMSCEIPGPSAAAGGSHVDVLAYGRQRQRQRLYTMDAWCLQPVCQWPFSAAVSVLGVATGPCVTA